MQVAALTCFWGPIQGRSLASYVDISHFLQGVHCLWLLVHLLVPSWDFSLVLCALTCATFKLLRVTSLKDLTLKTVLLVAVTSACRISEIQTLSCQDLFLFFSSEGVAIHLVPAFLPNVLSEFHLNHLVLLPTFWRDQGPEHTPPHLLDVSRVLWHYLKVTNPFRLSYHLFVLHTWSRRGADVSKAMIAQWVKKAIELVYVLQNKPVPVGLRAHSTWAQAMSWAERS